MSKAILVLDDMPAGCPTCQLCHLSVNYNARMCGAAKLEMAAEQGAYERRDDCPLREMPERRETVSIIDTMREAKLNHVTTANQFGYNVGWNDFIKVLNGDFLARERERYSDWEKEHDRSEWEDDNDE